MGFFDGGCYANTRETFDNHVGNCGDDSNVIDTDILDQEFYQNGSRNNTDHTGQSPDNGGLTNVNALQVAFLVSYQEVPSRYMMALLCLGILSQILSELIC